MRTGARRRTAIVATLGPASEDEATLGAMLDAGLDVARINCSHGTHDEHAQRIDLLRRLAAERGRDVGILVDLQGPKLRVGVQPEGGLVLGDGQLLRIVALGDEQRARAEAVIAVTQAVLDCDVKIGDRVLMDDGRLAAVVEAVEADGLTVRMVRGGLLRSKKGVNLPDSVLPSGVLTDKDRADIAFAVLQGASYLAVSFVQSPTDLLAVRELAEDIPLVAKIERPQAVACFEQICEVTDAIMVARGDLGVELDAALVPSIQKRLITTAASKGLTVITATEMLESMTSSVRATRAEVSDVANAVLDGTDAVMLSAESAAGAYPVQAVATMAQICLTTEAAISQAGLRHDHPVPTSTERPHAAALASAALTLAQRLDGALIAVFTGSGKTAQLVASARPDTPVVAFTPSERAAQRLSLCWGVQPILMPTLESTDELLAYAGQVLLTWGVADVGDTVIYLAGPANLPAGSDLLKIEVLR